MKNTVRPIRKKKTIKGTLRANVNIPIFFSTLTDDEASFTLFLIYLQF